jgi:epoxyqueuosine reductase
MRVLMHACCAPCSVYPVDALAGEGTELMLYFHNPNIHPYQEYVRRLDTLRDFAGRRAVKLIVDDHYDPQAWLRMVAFREAQRCRLCYHLRLTAAARAARRGRFDAFTSTLLYSKQQKHELIRELAEAVAEEVGVPFLYRDFRAGWKAGIETSKAMGLYRQQYCGCLYSEYERFRGPAPAGEEAN